MSILSLPTQAQNKLFLATVERHGCYADLSTFIPPCHLKVLFLGVLHTPQNF